MRKSPVKAYQETCLRGDLPGAIRALAASGSEGRAFFRKVDRRFVSKTESVFPACRDGLVREVVGAYRAYYREALQDSSRLAELNRALRSRVRKICAARKGIPWRDVEERLSTEFRKRGFHSLFGKVAPYHSLLVWKKQRVRVFRVPLISGTRKVKVVLLDDFVELGWMHYATFGRYHVGGWAKSEALYCVAQAYKRNYEGDRFRISYLTHEAQHQFDFENFPKLKAVDLEFRAKLAEIVASASPPRLVKKFRAEAKNDPAFPHCLAAYRVLRALRTAKSGAELRRKAGEVLAADPWGSASV